MELALQVECYLLAVTCGRTTEVCDCDVLRLARSLGPLDKDGLTPAPSLHVTDTYLAFFFSPLFWMDAIQR